MRKNKFLTILIFLGCCLLVTGCFKSKNNVTNEITNKVTNEITQKTTIYDITDNINTLEDAVKTCVKAVQSSVIGITLKVKTTSKINGEKVTFEDMESIGSGVIYKRVENKTGDKITSYTYYAYTNAHVVISEEEGDHVTYAYLGEYETEIPLTILGYDQKIDLACVKFDSYYYIEPVKIGNSKDLSKGNFVIAIGSPDGYDYYGSATFGIVSNLGRYISFDTDNDGTNDYVGEYIQTDAAINPGNSGGGLFTIDGKLIGINSIKLTSVKIDNMGFALPINLVKIAVEDYLEQGKTIVRPRLGVTCVAVKNINSTFMIQHNLTSLPNIYFDETPYGVYVENISSGGSLSNCGISKGDIILTFDGNKLYDNSDISGRLNALDQYTIGSKVEITYYSSKSEKIETVTITLKSGE